MSKQDKLQEMCQAHTDLNIFCAVQAVLEGGTVYTTSGRQAAQRIIQICDREAQKQVKAYDRMKAQLEHGGSK